MTLSECLEVHMSSAFGKGGTLGNFRGIGLDYVIGSKEIGEERDWDSRNPRGGERMERVWILSPWNTEEVVTEWGAKLVKRSQRGGSLQMPEQWLHSSLW